MATTRFIAITDERPPKPGDYWAYHYYTDVWVFIHWDGRQFPQRYNITHWTDAKEKTKSKPIRLCIGTIETRQGALINER